LEESTETKYLEDEQGAWLLLDGDWWLIDDDGELSEVVTIH
jgi:hypothetical protein